jgi:hypothetical protein
VSFLRGYTNGDARLFATNGGAAFRLSVASLRRTVQTWSEELSRALAATQRYEQMRISCGASVPRPNRQSNARQVFVEFYGGRQEGFYRPG